MIEGKIEITERGGRRHKKLLDGLKEIGGYGKLKEETLDCTLWKTHFWRVYGPVVRQTAKWLNEWILILILLRSFCCVL